MTDYLVPLTAAEIDALHKGDPWSATLTRRAIDREGAIERVTRCLADRAGDLEAYEQRHGYALEWREDGQEAVAALFPTEPTEVSDG